MAYPVAACRARGGGLQYWQRVLAAAPGQLLGYWPLWDTSGTVAVDVSGNGRNGAYVATPTLGQPGIGDGRTAITVDADGVNIYSTSLRDAFSPSAGTFMIWAKTAAAETWTDGTQRYMVDLYASGGQVQLSKWNTGEVRFTYMSSGLTAIDPQRRGTDWMCYVMTWDTVADELWCYVNGGPAGAVQTSLGTWSGTVLANLTCLGVLRVDSMNNPWVGGLGPAALWNVALPRAKVQNLHDAVYPTSGLFALGDSKTAGDAWIPLLCKKLDSTGRRWQERPLRYGTAGYTVADLKAFVDANLANEWQVPSIATINIGANDAASLPAEATWKANLTTIVDAVRAKWPTCRVYIAYPWLRDYGTECDTLAGWISAVIDAYADGVYAGPDERVWLEGGDDGATYTTDGVHYSAAGQVEAADQWLAVLTA